MVFFMIMRDGDRSIIENIYIKYRKEMRIAAYSILKDHQKAEDMVHQAIVKLSRHTEKIHDVKSRRTRAYVIQTVKNLCVDYVKEKWNQEGILSINSIVDETLLTGKAEELLEEIVIKKESAEELLKDIQKINESYAEIIWLRFYEQLDIGEISDLLSISKNNVSVRINRACESLKNIIEERGCKDAG